MSLAARPGTFGSRFHNHLYAALGLDWIYKAFTTTDLAAAIGGVRALGIRGCAISMPWKEAVIPLLDELASSARAIGSVNTIVNEGGRLVGHNTDYAAIRTLLRSLELPPSAPFALRGSGGMARAMACALRDAGFHDGTIVARNTTTGRALAAECGFRWSRELDVRPRLLFQASSLGMSGADAEVLAFPEAAIDTAELVLDVVAQPLETPLVRRARAAGKSVITGDRVLVLQAVDQFVLYTQKTPTLSQIESAAAYALG
jgi:shikimate dehydrogenase